MRTPILSPNRKVRPAAIQPKTHSHGDNLRGAMLMCVAMVFFTLNDTVMKFVTQDLPLYQSITIRGGVVMLGLIFLTLREGGLRLRLPRRAVLPMALRLVGEVGSTILFLNALKHMAIGDLSAIMQSLPLAVMLAAALFFGESLGWRRILAVLVGLAGVLMILRPGTSAFTVWSALGLGSVALVVLRDLATRMFSREISSSTIAFYAAVSVTLSAALLSIEEGWQRPTVEQAALLVLAGAFLTVGYMTVVATMRVGEISFVAPFRYVSLVVAILLGLVVFGEWPDLWTWIGAGLIVSAGIYSIWREGQLREG
ncbi:DMT family transporter [Paracoccus sp. M683]|uniref:DMT family transporter n=1 Tax=Paracoccus sp. M683 TaxID=2594268 RepID=UPI00117E90D7|nr:DMT family transporter [Paracoccus sp. M683]TRW95107.1 DMT family transporter [Paracoccus sp. M683]